MSVMSAHKIELFYDFHHHVGLTNGIDVALMSSLARYGFQFIVSFCKGDDRPDHTLNPRSFTCQLRRTLTPDRPMSQEKKGMLHRAYITIKDMLEPVEHRAACCWNLLLTKWLMFLMPDVPCSACFKSVWLLPSSIFFRGTAVLLIEIATRLAINLGKLLY